MLRSGCGQRSARGGGVMAQVWCIYTVRALRPASSWRRSPSRPRPVSREARPASQVQGSRGESESEPNAFVVECEDVDAPTLGEVVRSCAFVSRRGDRGDWRWRVRERDALFGYCW